MSDSRYITLGSCMIKEEQLAAFTCGDDASQNYIQVFLKGGKSFGIKYDMKNRYYEDKNKLKTAISQNRSEILE